MSIRMTCIRCGHSFTPTDDDIMLIDNDESVASAICPSCGNLAPVPDF
ncbi:MAG: hypothetical protein NWE83_06185 [Candidatus Bathyarchaeota archaeon]|nr:hypothetical protein [Candidatus Bathyarchaeota archaeon]